MHVPPCLLAQRLSSKSPLVPRSDLDPPLTPGSLGYALLGLPQCEWGGISCNFYITPAIIVCSYLHLHVRCVCFNLNSTRMFLAFPPPTVQTSSFLHPINANLQCCAEALKHTCAFLVQGTVVRTLPYSCSPLTPPTSSSSELCSQREGVLIT